MFAATNDCGVSIESLVRGVSLGEGEFSSVSLAHSAGSGSGSGRNGEGEEKRLLAVKTLRSLRNLRYFEREKSIHEGLNHPLIVGFEGYLPPTPTRSAQIVTEFVANGSFAELHKCEHRMSGTTIAIIVAGIVLAMRYLHSRCIIHRDLKPANVLVDWNLIVRICDFSHSLFADACGDARSDQSAEFTSQPSMDVRFTAPESFENHPNLKSDVFSFGLILYQLLTGNPAFSPQIPTHALMKRRSIDQLRPVIPLTDFISGSVRDLICECLSEKASNRPSFAEILCQLEGMDFQITSGVRPAKVHRFVRMVKAREKEMGIDIDDW
jgi:serine/threonine protein kinase